MRTTSKNWVQRLVNFFRADEKSRRPEPGRLLKSRKEDSWRDYPADGLTPARLSAILKAADQGMLAEPMQLFEQMEEKDAHLFSIANTRRLALTGLDWEIVPASDLRPGADAALSRKAADYCTEVLTAIETFEEALQHISLALGRNISIAELIWEFDGRSHRIVDIAPVDFTRLVFDDLDCPRLLTEEEPTEGVLLPPNKFVVHTPHAVSGHASRGGLLRVTALAFIGKNFALKDWLTFAEVFGMPVRIARYEPNASVEEKSELLKMLRNMGSDAAGVFSKAVELEIIEANRGTPNPPYEGLVNFLNREMTKAWLGQTLTVDLADQGASLAAAEVHDRVRMDIRKDDIRKEGRTIRRDILRPLVQFKFGREVPVPYFRRKLGPPGDLREFADVIAVAVNELGVQVPMRWVHDTLGIPVVQGDEPAIKRGVEGLIASRQENCSALAKS